MAFGMILVASGALAATKAKTTELKTPKDKASYAIGMDMAGSLKRNDIDVNPDVLAKAIKDVLTGKKPLMDDTEVKQPSWVCKRSCRRNARPR